MSETLEAALWELKRLADDQSLARDAREAADAAHQSLAAFAAIYQARKPTAVGGIAAVPPKGG